MVGVKRERGFLRGSDRCGWRAAWLVGSCCVLRGRATGEEILAVMRQWESVLEAVLRERVETQWEVMWDPVMVAMGLWLSGG